MGTCCTGERPSQDRIMLAFQALIEENQQYEALSTQATPRKEERFISCLPLPMD